MKRSHIFWFGKPPTEDDQQLVKDHEFELVVPRDNEPDFRFGRAAIFFATDSHFSVAAVSLKSQVAKALNEGLLVLAVVTGEEGDVRLSEVSKVLRNNDPHYALSDRYRVRSMPVSVHQLMHQALEHDPGPAKNLKLGIECSEQLMDSEVLLLQRAFHDCSSVRLESISPGYSGAKTFIAEARLTASNAGPEPEPFFVKLGDSRKLRAELINFQHFAEHHVPWYLRPNFIRERSIYGVADAILVGSFVRGSSSLAECARKGGGVQPIRSLFEETLVSLLRQSHAAEDGKTASVVHALADFSNHSKVPVQRRDEAARLFGGEPVNPDELWWQMLSLPPQPWRKSGIHGDMHGENVRVRKQDAIVIDFACACVGPATTDLASLEVWLSFECFDDGHRGSEWKTVVDRLYSPDAIDASLQNHTAIACDNWIQSCVAEIRRLVPAAVEHRDEYKRVLAVCLLRHASFPTHPRHGDEDEFRRSYAYWLSCQLVAGLRAEADPVLEAI